MKIIAGYQTLTDPIEVPVVTIGNFDGVHLGHLEILRAVQEKARSIGGKTVVYTFRPHPRLALRPQVKVPLLLTYAEKNEALANTGVDYLIEEPFSRDFSTTVPEQFFTQVLLRKINARAIVVGYDFAFGKERQGHLEGLKQFCEQFGVDLQVVPPLRIRGEIVSSSRIRQMLLEGNVDQAREFQGRPFFYRGVVVKGEGRGRKIGFPTANLKLENKLALPYGVYATVSHLNGKEYPSVTNVGVRPTFFQESEGLPALIETHLLDQTIDLYGSTLEVQFFGRLRSEQKFDGVEALQTQIRKDCESARVVLTKNVTP